MIIVRKNEVFSLINNLRLRQRLWALNERQRLGWYKKFAIEGKKFLDREADELAKIYLNEGKLGIISYFDIENLKMAELLRSLYNAVSEHFGSIAYDNLIGKGLGQGSLVIKQFNPFAFDKIFSSLWSAKRSTLITAASIIRANSIITAGIEESLTTYDISRNLRKFYAEDVNYRAMRMARTEVVMSSNSAGYYAVEQTGFTSTKKTWCTAADDRVRDSHAALEGETIGLAEIFSNGLEYPGDPNGDPDETIQCRCAIGYTIA